MEINLLRAKIIKIIPGITWIFFFIRTEKAEYVANGLLPQKYTVHLGAG